MLGALGLTSCQLRWPPWGPAPPPRLHVLMINGGGDRAQNYQSHLLHVKRLLTLVEAAGVAPEDVSVLASDGSDPAPDLAVREVQPETDFWLLLGTGIAHYLRTPVTYVDSTVPGVRLEPATRAGVETWFERARRRLRPGDTLLVYVTDHGSRNATDLTDNRITLWGKESLSVSELRTALARLPAGVRVVTLMSQCFSGSFAHLATPPDAELPDGHTCGFFASTADRFAYGCYPENRGRENVGHSFHFFEALAATPNLTAAHRETLVTDRTPDVPLATSDVFLASLLERAAGAEETADALADRLLTEAWDDKATWEPDIRLLDRIGHAFGLFSPRSLAELDAQAAQLPHATDTLHTYADAWRAALRELRRVNVARFVEAEPSWGPRLETAALRGLDAAARRQLADELLEALGPFTRTSDRLERLLRLRDRTETAAAAAYRMEVRNAVILRLRMLLRSIAGRQWLATRASSAERDAWLALRECENLQLAEAPLEPGLAGREPLEAFPPYTEDRRLAERVMPAWMGIRFRPPSASRRAAAGIGAGAAAVVAVYPDSPAAAAGLDVGDIVLGPPAHHFTEPNQIREWTMLSAIDRPVRLDTIRDRRRRRITLVPKPFPLTWPELPGPPKIGSIAPPLRLSTYRGRVPRTPGRDGGHLLFFWATWCGPCKASLPELLAWEAETGTPVVAITDEPAERLDAFFAKFDAPFPERVAIDEFRRAFLAYGVSGTPTFVLVDDAGRVRHYATGYTPASGLGLAGWTWTPPAATP